MEHDKAIDHAGDHPLGRDDQLLLQQERERTRLWVLATILVLLVGSLVVVVS